MKRFYLFISISIISAQQIDKIPYDWGGQFGYINKNGSLFWNEDWNSNGLFFDGTWTNYPRMFGHQIEENFLQKEPYHSQNYRADTSLTTTWFKYDQGDYLLDRFSMGANYNNKNRQVQFHGFKRSYAGGIYNPYESGSVQPIQQTYTFSYLSQKGQDDGGISIGYFNTHSGIADSTALGLIDNRITTASTFWKRNMGQLVSNLSLNNFLQRYDANHSLSTYRGIRYLTRSKIFGGLILTRKDQTVLSASLEINQRNTRVDTSITVNWIRWNILAEWSKFRLDLGIVSGDDKMELENFFEYKNYFGQLSGSVHFNRSVRPRHVYYNIIQGYPENLFTQNTTIHTELEWETGKNNIALFATSTQREIPLSSPDESKIAENIFIGCNYAGNFFLNFQFDLKYSHQLMKNEISDGIADKIQTNMKNQFQLFNGFMLLDGEIKITGWLNRDWQMVMHPIEMIPFDYADTFESLDDIWFVNASLTANVSTFKVKYEWININEMILASLGSLEDNFFEIHPIIPKLGRQVILSVEWHFLN
ncbi:MAG: hypothetical protein CMG57_01220 [Candidatus Marinimicrobia bacterium]|nr:hypothetical protein [Candidatus Neomarinimicrobiota bacterium]